MVHKEKISKNMKCPSCNIEMVLKELTTGSQSRYGYFWECPKCKRKEIIK